MGPFFGRGKFESTNPQASARRALYPKFVGDLVQWISATIERGFHAA